AGLFCACLKGAEKIKSLKPVVWHGHGSVMIWRSFAEAGHVQLTTVEIPMSSDMYRRDRRRLGKI
uniref:Uncharacterized protein n=2 Tax=Poecilia TaxID=8080 RepID=A0A3B3TJJ1_9TELE